MKPWVLIDSSSIPGTNGVMELMQRGDEWLIE